MSNKSYVEIADRKSRLRPLLYLLAVAAYLVAQIMTRAEFSHEPFMHGLRLRMWAINAGLLLLVLSNGGGILNHPRLRALINDDVARQNYRTACKLGFWLVMISMLIIYFIPSLRTLTGPQVIYLEVSLGTVTSVLAFAWLEYRAHHE